MANLPKFFTELEGEAQLIQRHGPFECPRCHEPYDDITAYCRQCGYVTHVFAGIDRSNECPTHTSQPPVDFCCLCGRTVCKLCKQEFEAGESPRTYHCKDCASICERLEKAFLKDILNRKVCPRHRDTRSELKCRECGLPACDSCAYVWVEGLLFKRIINGPFCEACKFKSFPWRPRLRLRTISDCRTRRMKIPQIVFDP